MADASSPRRQRIRLPLSTSAHDRWVTVSLLDKTCNCETFRAAGGCAHLRAIGIHHLKPFTPTTHPTFSQALSGLVKSLRIRRLEEAAYWLVYLDTFQDKPFRFRTARRLLIASAEDGHSVAVMEKVGQSFPKMSRPTTELDALVAEAARICKLPNWWDPDTGGPDYIYQSLIGQRTWWYRRWDRRVETLRTIIEKAIEENDRAVALGGVMAFDDTQERCGSTKQAEFLLRVAESVGHSLAARLCKIHLSAKSALSGDNNFLCQAAWMMSGGVSPIAEDILPVTADECTELLDRARQRWKNPKPIPHWCLDGVHSAGQDPRLMGCFPEMWAVCQAFRHYGRVDPSDEWLAQFQCYDGLLFEEVRGTEEG